MPFPGLPPKLHEQVVCSIYAAIKYEIPANILLAIAEKEAGKPGQWVRNSNGSYDVGSLQFNTQYLRTLSRYGIAPADLAQAGCYPFELAAWRVRQHLRTDSGDMWTRAANYHSRTPRFNGIYRADLMKRAARWADWLEHRFVVYDTARKPAVAASTFSSVEGVTAAPQDKTADWTSAQRSMSENIPRSLIQPKSP